VLNKTRSPAPANMGPERQGQFGAAMLARVARTPVCPITDDAILEQLAIIIGFVIDFAMPSNCCSTLLFFCFGPIANEKPCLVVSNRPLATTPP
jgi:hypothetical protein